MALNEWPLDANSVIQSVYDIDENALRVNTQATIVAGAMEVAIDASTDSIKVSDGTDTLAVNPDGSINVNITSTAPTGSVISDFGSVTSVPMSVLTTINSYTIGLSVIGYLERIECSGTNIAQYEIYISSVLQARQRTYFGGALDVIFEFVSPTAKGLLLTPGTVIEVKVIHLRPTVGDFDARIQLSEI